MATPLKEYLDAAAVRRLGEAFAAAADGAFDVEAFAADATSGLDALELKARIDHVAAALGRALPADFAAAAALARRAVDRAPELSMFEVWPVTTWAGAAAPGDLDGTVALLAALTARASAEMAIRPLIDADPERMRAVLDDWARSDDEHLRRLASEGTRPRLPWAPRVAVLEAEPGWALPLLDRLRDDPEEYVRRSVANHLNDLAKVAPELALATAARWRAEGGAHVDRVLRHGLRTLVKGGDPRALRLVGIDPEAPVDVELELRTPTVRVGDALEFAVALRGAGDEPVTALVDYVVHLVRANGTRGRKVFKLRTLTLHPGERVELVRRQSFRPVTTRRHYPGRHRLEIQCNGAVRAGADFDLVA